MAKAGKKEFFKGIGRIRYEGRDSTHPLSFKFYDENRVVGNKTMKEHLRFAIAYWHSFCGTGNDPFGPGTKNFPWDARSQPMDKAKDRLDAAFEFISKLGAPFYCFHDIDMSPEGKSLAEYEKNLFTLAKLAKAKQKEHGVKLLWGTANLFSNPKFMNGAATNPDFNVLAHAAVQVKAMLEVTLDLGGENYVFWGGREGYQSLWNTDMKREVEHLARFLALARDYGRKIGFKGTFLIEPKPCEPSKHQYDFDSATVCGFLRQYGLAKDFKLNLEANHATLAGHSFAHELKVAAMNGMLGSIDANRGDEQNGWDTDQFPTNLYDTVEAMTVLLEAGGFKTGGFNFDAKTRRNSTDLEDLFIAHIGGMDAFARGLLVAHKLLTESDYLKMRHERYASYESGDGARYESGKLDLVGLSKIAFKNGTPKLHSGKQEQYENLVNQLL
ncbi:MAG: xylose isomerase [Spirochaetia bacterium]|nr:xylose isomerase [Spirochaetia bacterium]